MNKHELLSEVRTAIRSGEITRTEVMSMFESGASLPPQHLSDESVVNKLDAPKVLGIIGGLLLFGATLAMYLQLWGSIGWAGRILLPLLVAAIAWIIGVIEARKHQGGNQYGLGGIASGFGSLVLIVLAVAVIAWYYDRQAVSTSDPIWMVIGTLFVYTMVHLGYGLVAKSVSIWQIFAIAWVATYGVFVSYVFDESVQSLPELGAIFSLIGAAQLLGFGYVYAAKTNYIKEAAQSMYLLGALGVLLTMYGLVLGGRPEVLWTVLFAPMMYATFIASIAAKRVEWLYLGSFFLVLFVLTIVFRYFGTSGFWVAGGLLASAITVLGTAKLTSELKKKYF